MKKMKNEEKKTEERIIEEDGFLPMTMTIEEEPLVLDESGSKKETKEGIVTAYIREFFLLYDDLEIKKTVFEEYGDWVYVDGGNEFRGMWQAFKEFMTERDYYVSRYTTKHTYVKCKHCGGDLKHMQTTYHAFICVRMTNERIRLNDLFEEAYKDGHVIMYLPSETIIDQQFIDAMMKRLKSEGLTVLKWWIGIDGDFNVKLYKDENGRYFNELH